MSGPDRKNVLLSECLARTVNAAGLVEYSAGSVVSKTILDKAAGTVTVFSFDSGQRLSEHTSSYDAIIFALDGKAVVTIGGKPQELAEAEVVVMPANVPHSLEAVERFKMLLILVRE